MKEATLQGHMILPTGPWCAKQQAFPHQREYLPVRLSAMETEQSRQARFWPGRILSERGQCLGEAPERTAVWTVAIMVE